MPVLWSDIGLFVGATVAIAVVSPRISRVTEQLARATGIGATLAGALFLGASTSVSGHVISAGTAYAGSPTISLGNAVGAVAAQTMFIALADVALRSDTIEHEDTRPASLLQVASVATLLSVLVFGMVIPEYAAGGIHLVSPIVIGGILAGFWMSESMRREPAWVPDDHGRYSERSEPSTDEDGGRTSTSNGEGPSGDDSEPNSDTGRQGDTRSNGNGDETKDWKSDDNGDESGRSNRELAGRYFVYLAVVAVGGLLISISGSSIVEQTGLDQLLMGSTFMAISGSLPELVTAIAAVRQRNVAIAVGDLVGSNLFDTSMVVVSDVAYRGGTVFAAVSRPVLLLVILVLVMTGVLLVGLLRREQRGFANVGIQSYAILALYAGGIVLMFLTGGLFSGG